MASEYHMTQFALLRHEKTQWNKDKRIQGQSNSPLTPEGKIRAQKWGHLLKVHQWNRIITSDMGRALETAVLVNVSLQIPLIHDPRLREQNWGQWTGKTLEQLKKENPLLLAHQESAGWDFCPPDGENRNMVWERSQTALKAATKKWSGEKILVVTHEGVIKCLIYRLLGRRFLPTEKPIIRSHRLHWILHDGEGFRLGQINEQTLP